MILVLELLSSTPPSSIFFVPEGPWRVGHVQPGKVPVVNGGSYLILAPSLVVSRDVAGSCGGTGNSIFINFF